MNKYVMGLKEYIKDKKVQIVRKNIARKFGLVFTGEEKKQNERLLKRYGHIFNEIKKEFDEYSDERIDIENLKYIHKYKTGALFKCAILMGAKIAQADEQKIKELEK